VGNLLNGYGLWIGRPVRIVVEGPLAVQVRLLLQSIV
jgi:hypothetical protein